MIGIIDAKTLNGQKKTRGIDIISLPNKGNRLPVDLHILNHKLKDLYTAYYTAEEQYAIDALIDSVRAIFEVAIDTLGKEKQYTLVRDLVAVCADHLL